jgi:glyoxylase-like metal-dependent hydrolase (beta-lactamase superfamily II)
MHESVHSATGFFGLPNWPDGEAALELGNQRLTVFPIPGHEAAHIAVHDPGNKWLLTGDTLYAGLLTIAARAPRASRISPISTKSPNAFGADHDHLESVITILW